MPATMHRQCQPVGSLEDLATPESHRCQPRFVFLMNNYDLRKPAGQAGKLFFCERSERLGVWGELLPNMSVFPASVGVQGAHGECVAG